MVEYVKLGAIPLIISILHQAEKEGKLLEIINEIDSKGDCAVLWASHQNNIDIMKLLIGAKTRIFNDNMNIKMVPRLEYVMIT